MAELTVNVVSAESEIWSGQAKFVSAKTVDGEIGILPGHQPLLAILASGEVKITPESGDRIVANAEDGFLSVDKNNVTIVAGNASIVE